ncbi:Protein IMPACT-B [Hypsizygus marmoreus]|uniref:Protein IMPACT-B n=1 Tax=Hypsizygus marmoreus TaxID=39966 RepID=A0A369JD00_HYPMA|nr:Protein IMPACT-B [Hypsizygus marmoreus]
MNHGDEVAAFIADLGQNPEREAVASELEVLQSIYGDSAIRLWHPPESQPRETRHHGNNIEDAENIRYEAELSLLSPHEDISVRILISLPPTYPASSPPQLQLLSRYIGAFGADSGLFGSVLRTFISVNGVEWIPDSVCVFDGLQSVVERCTTWYENRLSMEKAGELLREDAKEHLNAQSITSPSEAEERRVLPEDTVSIGPLTSLPDGLQLFTAEPITDRKSAFVGRACRISHPSEVPLVLNHLMTDRRISRAAHPIINAWRCQVGTVLHQDNDDDGETAAGGRLAHLLQILEVNNVLVIVTRYFGGIHLGPDRFKHINQAARNALELGGFLDAMEAKKSGRGKKH